MVTKKNIESMRFTTVHQYGFKQLFKADKNGYTFILSYRTIIGYMGGKTQTIFLTEEFYSVTTSKHKGFIRNNYRQSLLWTSIITLNQTDFDTRVRKLLNYL